MKQITNKREQITKNKRFALFTLLSVICYLLFVFSACNNLLEPPKMPQKNDYGKISVILEEEDAADIDAVSPTERTVLPSTVFDRYEYTFIKSGATTGEVKTPVNGSFTLEVGKYTVTVKAYSGDTQAATGVSEEFDVGSGTNASVKIRLSRGVTGEPGKFKYTITYPAGAAAEITLQKWPELSNITMSPVTQGNGITQTLDNVGAGSYLLTIIVKQDGRYAGKNEAVHIYPSNLTEYTKNFTEGDLLASIPPTINAAGTALTAGVWADGTVSANGEQWFMFIATSSTQYIHADFGTLTNMYVQLYDSTGATFGNNSNLNSSAKYITRSVTSGKVYFIKVTPGSGNSGAYKIAFNTSTTPPSSTATLTADTWADGNITSSSGEQWFKFTATANTQYIHVNFNTLTDLYVQVYDSANKTVGDNTSLSSSSSNKYISRTVTSGQEYFIKVTPYYSSGTYKIAFNSAQIPPVTATLTADTWADGELPSSGEQWFKFIATASTQYIHVNFGTLSSSNGLYVQMYNSSGNTVGSQTNLNSSTKYTSRTVTSGQVYYIMVTPYYSSGTYKIAFNTTWSPPGIVALTADTWADGELPSSSGEQWFKFTATASTQYIHVNFGTLNSSYGLYVQMYNSSGTTVGSQTNLSSSTKYISQSVTSGQVYYIKVTPYSSYYSGTYKIAFNTTQIPPGIVALTADTWADGDLPSSGEQWFKFTATANTQYIHVNFGTLNSSYGLYVQMYESDGSTVVGSQTRLYSSTTYTSQTITSDQEYFIKVTPYSSSYSGTYKIAFNTTQIPPGVVTLTADTWADGDLPSSGEQWFKFTATASTQYIHVNFGTLDSSNGLYVQVYESNGSTTVGSQTRLYSSTTYTSQTITADQEYFIKVTPYYSYYSGTYKIAFASTDKLPVTATLTADTWADGDLPYNGEQWFKFTATANTQYIHVSFDTMDSSYGLNVQVYDSDGSTTVGSQTNLNSSTTYTSQAVTNGQEYFIKVTPSYYYYSGTYKIAFNSAQIPPVTATLTADTWTDGELTAYGEQWFKFTATASTQYIYVDFDTLTSLNIQVYNSNGGTVGNQENLDSSITYTSQSVTNGQVYYIKVTPNSYYDSGTYKITFNSTWSPPGVATLTADTWADGDLPSNGEQWFKFTATASTQYIHTSFGTLSSSNGVYVQMYNSSGTTVGSQTNFNSSTRYISQSVTNGQVYYIKVTPYYSYNSGTYKIAFNTTWSPPGVATLTADTWADGNLPSNGEQWFKFTATASTQYIHTSFGTLNSSNGLYVQVYNSSGSTVGSQTNLNSSTRYTSQSVTSGQVYFIKVTPYSSSYSGTYWIAFNTLPASPGVPLLTAGTWADVDISSYNGEQWFKFTATAVTQYLHVNFGTSSSGSINIQVYTSTNTTVGNNSTISSSSSTKYITRTVTSGQVYYVKVTSDYYSSTCKIAFNTSATAPY
jgi:hypothetical protein